LNELLYVKKIKTSKEDRIKILYKRKERRKEEKKRKGKKKKKKEKKEKIKP
jgi:hypothetical protein